MGSKRGTLIQFEKTNRKRDATPFELWASLFEGDCALLFNSRGDLITGSNHIFSHLRKFGLQMQIGRGATASKSEAMYFLPPRQAYAAAGTSRFLVDGTGSVELRASSIWARSSITLSPRTPASASASSLLQQHSELGKPSLVGNHYLSEEV